LKNECKEGSRQPNLSRPAGSPFYILVLAIALYFLYPADASELWRKLEHHLCFLLQKVQKSIDIFIIREDPS
jgi:hypothetical protein